MKKYPIGFNARIKEEPKKEPPMKGTKRWNKQQKAIKKKECRREIRNVISLIDSLSVGACVAQV